MIYVVGYDEEFVVVYYDFVDVGVVVLKVLEDVLDGIFGVVGG